MLKALAENKIFKAVKSFISIEVDEEAPEQYTRSRMRSGGGKVVPINQDINQAMINIKKPRTIDDAREAADLLKEGRVVVLNLSQIEKELGKEIVYFLSGITYALNGDYKKVGNDIFLFTPFGVAVTQLEELQKKDTNQNSLSFQDF